MVIAVYAVKQGRVPGLYTTWEDCKRQVDGFSHCDFQKFPSLAEAEAWMRTAALAGKKQTTALPPTQVAMPAERPHTGGLRAYIGAAYQKSPHPELGVWPARASYSVYYGTTAKLENLYGRIRDDALTKQRALLIAILKAIAACPTHTALEVCTDSGYAFACLMVHAKKWQSNKWRNAKHKPVVNGDLVRACLNLAKDRKVVLTVKAIERKTHNIGLDAAAYLAHRGLWQESSELEAGWVQLGSSMVSSFTESNFGYRSASSQSDVHSDGVSTVHGDRAAFSF